MLWNNVKYQQMAEMFLQQKKIAKRIQEWDAIYFTDRTKKKTIQSKTSRGLTSYLFYIFNQVWTCLHLNLIV